MGIAIVIVVVLVIAREWNEHSRRKRVKACEHYIRAGVHNLVLGRVSIAEQNFAEFARVDKPRSADLISRRLTFLQDIGTDAEIIDLHYYWLEVEFIIMFDIHAGEPSPTDPAMSLFA